MMAKSSPKATCVMDRDREGMPWKRKGAINKGTGSQESRQAEGKGVGSKERNVARARATSCVG